MRTRHLEIPASPIAEEDERAFDRSNHQQEIARSGRKLRGGTHHCLLALELNRRSAGTPRSRNRRRQIFGKTLQRAGPSAVMRIARRDRLEKNLMQGQFGLSAEIFEGYRQQRFRLGRATFRIRPDIGANKSLRLDDLAIYTLLPKVSAVCGAQAKPIGAAASEIHLD